MAMLCDWSGRTSLCQKLADGIRGGARVTVPVVVLSHLDERELQLAGARWRSTSWLTAAGTPSTAGPDWSLGGRRRYR
jgi:hypothetical protein